VKRLNVLLVGDICDDVYHYGNVNRISPEAPVPVLELTHTKKLAGMAANVSKNLQSLGVNITEVVVNKVSVKTRFIDEKSGHQLLRLDEDAISDPISINDIPHKEYDCIVISDYGKGSLDYKNIKHIINAYSSLPIFIDTKKTDLEKFDQIFPPVNVFIKINSPESKKVTSFHRNVIVTDGKNGARYKGNHYPCPQVNVADACGAGDTFLAALAVYYCESKDMQIAINYANIAASLTVQHLGVYAPTKEEIYEAIG
jgi:D-beta-D-heptose 7-phosphate kinase/D-beta-D-heptose 1-phosphate adenosyltransferase